MLFARRGPRHITHPDGTVQTVFAGPNRIPRWRRSLWALLVDVLGVLAAVMVGVGGSLLVVEYRVLSVASRLGIAGLLVLSVGAYVAGRLLERRKVGN